MVVDAGPFVTENQFPCQTLVACLSPPPPMRTCRPRRIGPEGHGHDHRHAVVLSPSSRASPPVSEGAAAEKRLVDAVYDDMRVDLGPENIDGPLYSAAISTALQIRSQPPPPSPAAHDMCVAAALRRCGGGGLPRKGPPRDWTPAKCGEGAAPWERG